MNLLRKATTPAIPRTLEAAVLSRARAEVGRMRRVFEVRESRPVHIHRAWCEDCHAVVELVDDKRCFCGSRSVAAHRARSAA